jgi:hypothetical protein
MSLNSDGTKSLPVKLGGRFHIPGIMDMADRNAEKSLFTIAVPLFRAGGEHVKVIVTPLMRQVQLL